MGSVGENIILVAKLEIRYLERFLDRISRPCVLTGFRSISFQDAVSYQTIRVYLLVLRTWVLDTSKPSV